MIRTLIWFIYFCLYLICSIPAWLRLKHLEKKGRQTQVDALLFKKAGKWARSLLVLAGAKVTITGAEHVPASGAALFVSNHQGDFDIPVLLGLIDKPKAFIAKAEAQKIPFISSWMTMMKCVFIKRQSRRQSLDAIHAGARILKNGRSLVIFPEGTRSKSSRLGSFKPGSLKLALASGVPIVPVTINGSYRLLERQGFLIKPAAVDLIISPPIYPAADATARELATQIREIIQANLACADARTKQKAENENPDQTVTLPDQGQTKNQTQHINF